ncbi:MAG: ferritin-like domain-containing protein [Gluconacetobacter diazotrophicus]|nr:ferritin-like domain-containing protein [Gluconacetobacter diazotrophicus]
MLRDAGLGLAGTAALGLLASSGSAAAATSADLEILNFALNLEYLGAEYYLHAVTGQGLDAYVNIGFLGGTGRSVVAGGLVPFRTPAVAYFAQQLANDELAHVRFIQDLIAPGGFALPGVNAHEPRIDLSATGAWTSFALAAGLIGAGQTFDPYRDEIAFLVGAYVLEDLCVSALAGAVASLTNPDTIAYAAGLLGAEAYQAGAIRGYLADIGGGTATNAISALRARLSGVGDEGTNAKNNPFNISNADVSAQAFRRTPQQVLNVAFGASGTGVTQGLFFPFGVNGTIVST